MSIKLKDFIKDPSNVFTEEEAIMIFKSAGYIDIEEEQEIKDKSLDKEQ